MKVRYRRIVEQVCEIEVSEKEFEDEFESDEYEVPYWGEDTGDFDVIEEKFPIFKYVEIIEE